MLVDGSGPRKPLAQQRLNARMVRWLRLWLCLAMAAVFALLYLLSEAFRVETNRALGILSRGDVAGLRDYIVSFGAWDR